jgi:hypothetical protein
MIFRVLLLLKYSWTLYSSRLDMIKWHFPHQAWFTITRSTSINMYKSRCLTSPWYLGTPTLSECLRRVQCVVFCPGQRWTHTSRRSSGQPPLSCDIVTGVDETNLQSSSPGGAVQAKWEMPSVTPGTP